VAFGDVVVGSQASRDVKLHNFGDLGAKFKFEVPARFSKIFSVSPAEGFVRPAEEIPLTVAFHPTRERMVEFKRGPAAPRKGKGAAAAPAEYVGPLNMRVGVKDIKCLLEGIEPLTLEATGCCVERTGETKTLEFKTEVRKELKQSFEVQNTSDVGWRLHPQVVTKEPEKADFFKCPREVEVPAGKTAAVEITYLPFTMTEPEEGAKGGEPPSSPSGAAKRLSKHKGSVFIGTPDGNAILYSLEGIAFAPQVNTKMQESVACKKHHTQKVPVKNWLNERQRFDVQVELVEPAPDSEDAQGVSIQGVNTLDLPPGLEREYKFSVYAYREGSAKVLVSFTSQDTGEFIRVEVCFDFVAPVSLSLIRLEAPCRQTAKHKIAVANPLTKPAKFKGRCLDEKGTENGYIKFNNNQEFEVPAKSERTIELRFCPVQEGSGKAEAILESSELGAYPYTVHWKATAAGMERSLTLKAPLGGSASDHFKFIHMARQDVMYKARIEPATGKGTVTDFYLEDVQCMGAKCDEGGSKELQLKVRYQPSKMGTKDSPSVSALLVIAGEGGGEYKATLTGFAQHPQPQGPYDIFSGKSANIEFRNPFDKVTEFSLQVDNPCFTVPSRSVSLDPSKSSSIQVNFKAEKPQGGRLMISCKQVSTPWVFYLKGEM